MRQGSSTTLRLAGRLLPALLLLLPLSLSAATITVSGGCTLADAIDSANTDGASGSPPCAAGSGADTIVLTANVTRLAALPAITESVDIEGNGFTVARDPGASAFRVFEVTGGATDAIFEDVTVSGGIDDVGGGIFVVGAEVGLLNSTVSGNAADDFGGGIFVADGLLYASYSEVSGNTVEYFGGGIANSYDSTTFLLASEVSGNLAGIGGGVGNGVESGAVMLGSTVSGNFAIFGGGTTNFIDSGLFPLLSVVKDNTAYFAGAGTNSYGVQYASYSEFSGNTAYYVVGGFFNSYDSELLAENSTFSGNVALDGPGGGLVNDGFALLRNTTFSGNSGGAGTYGGAVYNIDDATTVAYGSLFANSGGSNCDGAVTDGGGNLADDDSCGTIPDTLTGLDPVLADNGAFYPFPTVDTTRTHALLPGSTAIDAAGACGFSGDQRFAPRDAACDSGAYEFGAIDSDGDGVPDEADVCPDTVIPEGVPTVRLGTNRWALTDGDLEFDTKAPNGKGPGRSYSTEDTAGCSCEQIIDELGLGNGHTKFGCSISAMDDWVALVGG